MVPCPPPLLARLYGDGRYWSQPVVLAAADDEFAANVADVRFPHLPELLAGGVEISDRSGAGLWRLPLPAPVEVPAGVAVLVPAGALRVPLAEAVALGVVEAPAATGGAAGAALTVGAAPVGAALGVGESARSQANTRS